MPVKVYKDFSLSINYIHVREHLEHGYQQIFANRFKETDEYQNKKFLKILRA